MAVFFKMKPGLMPVVEPVGIFFLSPGTGPPHGGLVRNIVGGACPGMWGKCR